jgi:hypothetical protein
MLLDSIFSLTISMTSKSVGLGETTNGWKIGKSLL